MVIINFGYDPFGLSKIFSLKYCDYGSYQLVAMVTRFCQNGVYKLLAFY